MGEPGGDPLNLSPLTGRVWVRSALHHVGQSAANFTSVEDPATGWQTITEATLWGWIVWDTDGSDPAPGARVGDLSGHVAPALVRVVRPGIRGVAWWRTRPRVPLLIQQMGGLRLPGWGVDAHAAAVGAAAAVPVMAATFPTVGGLAAVITSAVAGVAGAQGWKVWRRTGAFRDIILDDEGWDLTVAGAGVLRLASRLDPQPVAGQVRSAVHQVLWQVSGRADDAGVVGAAVHDLRALAATVDVALRAEAHAAEVARGRAPLAPAVQRAVETAADPNIESAVAALAAHAAATLGVAAITARQLGVQMPGCDAEPYPHPLPD